MNKDKTLIEIELANDKWFKRIDKKFLHNIDTFYYSVKLNNDFTFNSNDKNVIQFRKYFCKYDDINYDSVLPIYIPGSNDIQLNIMPFSFAGFYKYCISCPERFDIFLAHHVPSNYDLESVTSEIIVQIRSLPLWHLGINSAYEESFNVVKNLCDMFNLEIKEVKENRVDYCWHSNYLQDPSNYFRIDNFSSMQVSRFRRIHYEYQFKPGDEYENDYICLGKRSDKVFVRIYLKSKEVVEKGYKPWFFKIWHENGLISDYDLEIYEKCFLMHNWNYLNIARLEFYLEYGTNNFYLNEIKKILSGDVKKAELTIKRLADKLTPAVTLITNVEYQTMRKSSKSYILKELKDNNKYGVSKRIYDYLDNRSLITEYLTHDTLRLINRTEENKSRCDYNEFWNRLRSCKFIDVAKLRKGLKLKRKYSRNLNKEIVKRKMLNSAITYSIYSKGINDDDVITDCAAALLRLNDNDIENMRKYKEKKKKLLNNEDLSGMINDNRQSFVIINEDGEII